MKINDYIIRGGENLNDAPKKTPSFPSDAERIFNEWHSKLGNDDEEKENYFELPVNEENRLFIRSFYVEKAGHRPISFYVGLLIPKTAYEEVKNYYCMHKGLCSVTLDKIQEAVNASFLPIEVTTDWPILKSPIGHNFQQLSEMKLYGDKEFNSNINQMCFSISTNNIDDWFSRLFIAVNPYRMSDSFHVVVSRERPRPPITEDIPMTTKTPEHPIQTVKENQNRQRPFVGSPQIHRHHQSPKNVHLEFKHLFVILLIIALVMVCLCLFIRYNNQVPLSEYYAIQAENENLKKTKDELSAKCTELDKENNRLQRENKELEKRIVELEKMTKGHGQTTKENNKTTKENDKTPKENDKKKK